MAEDKTFYVYMLTNKYHNVLYTGMTSDMPQRVFRHGHGYYPNAFTKKYNVTILVYVEEYNEAHIASHREWLLKRWHHDWKAKLVTDFNPDWHDLGLQLS